MLVTIHSTWRGVLQPPTRRVCPDYSQQEALWTLQTCDNALLCVNAPLFPATRLPGYQVTVFCPGLCSIAPASSPVSRQIRPFLFLLLLFLLPLR